MQHVIGRFSLGFVLCGAVVVGGVAEGGEIDFGGSSLVVSEWDRSVDFGDIVNEGVWTKQVIKVTQSVGWVDPTFIMYHTDVLGGLTGASGPLDFIDGLDLFRIIFDRVSVLGEIVVPVAPVEPVYVPTVGVVGVDTDVSRGLSGVTSVRLWGETEIQRAGHGLPSSDSGASSRLSGEFGSAIVVLETDDQNPQVASAGFVGLHATYLTGGRLLGSEAKTFDLMSVDGRGWAVAGFGNTEGWIDELSSDVSAKSRASGTYKIGHAGELFGSVKFSSQDAGGDFYLQVTDVITDEVSYRFDMAEHVSGNGEGTVAFDIGGAVDVGTYKFEIVTSLDSGVTFDNADVLHEEGMLAYEFDLGVKFGVDEAYKLYEIAYAEYLVLQDRYVDSVEIYDVEVSLREMLIEKFRLTEGLDGYELVGDELIKYGEPGSIFDLPDVVVEEDEPFIFLPDLTFDPGLIIFRPFDISDEEWAALLAEKEAEEILKAAEEAAALAIEAELLAVAEAEAQAIADAGAIEAQVIADAAEVVRLEELRVALIEVGAEIFDKNAEFEGLQAAYFAKHGVYYVATIPEPSSILLLSLLGAGVLRRRIG